MVQFAGAFGKAGHHGVAVGHGFVARQHDFAFYIFGWDYGLFFHDEILPFEMETGKNEGATCPPLEKNPVRRNSFRPRTALQINRSGR